MKEVNRNLHPFILQRNSFFLDKQHFEMEKIICV